MTRCHYPGDQSYPTLRTNSERYGTGGPAGMELAGPRTGVYCNFCGKPVVSGKANSFGVACNEDSCRKKLRYLERRASA